MLRVPRMARAGATTFLNASLPRLDSLIKKLFDEKSTRRAMIRQLGGEMARLFLAAPWTKKKGHSKEATPNQQQIQIGAMYLVQSHATKWRTSKEGH